MDKLEKELTLYKILERDLEKNGISPIWALTDHIGFLQRTIEKHKKQDSCPHTDTKTEDISVHRRPRTREYCTVCNKTIKEY